MPFYYMLNRGEPLRVYYEADVFKKYGIIQSMSLKGNCWDNTVAESFFHTLKIQLIYHIRLNNFEEAERIIFKYIKIYYNQRRKHSAYGWKAPAHC